MASPTPQHNARTTQIPGLTTTEPGQSRSVQSNPQPEGRSLGSLDTLSRIPQSSPFLSSVPAGAKATESAVSIPHLTPISVPMANNVSLLNHQCQLRGLRAKYEIGGFGTAFSGFLMVGDQKIMGKTIERTKKEVKENLAGEALDVLGKRGWSSASSGLGAASTSVAAVAAPSSNLGVRARAGVGAGAGTGGGVGVGVGLSASASADVLAHGSVGMEQEQNQEHQHQRNWVGALHELHAHLPPNTQPVFDMPTIHEPRSANPLYACTVLIPLRPNSPFGSAIQGFSAKKAAKTSAAREAVLWLESSGTARELGGKGKKVSLTSRSNLPDGSRTNPSLENPEEVDSEEESSPSQRVVFLCEVLGLTPPSYRFSCSELNPLLFEGAAWFKAEPKFPGPVGEVRNVVGRKRAKDECARKVVEILETLKIEAENDFQRLRL